MDDYSQSEWSRFAKEGGIGICMVQADCVDDGSGLLTCKQGDRITALCQMSAAPGTTETGNYIWVGLETHAGFPEWEPGLRAARECRTRTIFSRNWYNWS